MIAYRTHPFSTALPRPFPVLHSPECSFLGTTSAFTKSSFSVLCLHLMRVVDCPDVEVFHPWPTLRWFFQYLLNLASSNVGPRWLYDSNNSLGFLGRWTHLANTKLSKADWTGWFCREFYTKREIAVCVLFSGTRTSIFREFRFLPFAPFSSWSGPVKNCRNEQASQLLIKWGY